MNRPKHYSRCWTIRLTPVLDDGLENLAYDWRLPKAGAIRHILGRAIAEAYSNAAPDKTLHFAGGQR
jgi:hypothetical protein